TIPTFHTYLTLFSMNNSKDNFFGITTIGEKGQMVVPIEARKMLKFDKGEKLLVFGIGKDTLIITKTSQLEAYKDKLSKKLESLQNIRLND
ncbi:AbrB/MazE/SpoVT family DNA-binding domain-containing protein, partial [bacterium]|nr:AbrB/MazE/SpoVT family DNA-binding domain-containing protein [bacterium]